MLRATITISAGIPKDPQENKTTLTKKGETPAEV